MLQRLYEDLNSLDVNLVNSLFRMLLSMALGVVIGAERKRKGQIAGIRTFALITMGACLAMLLSIYVPQVYMGLKNGDPARIAAQVITGIGFLGGGAMIRGIWISAIIGMAVGVGMYVVSIGTTVLILMVLVMFDWYEHWQSVGQESKAINIRVRGIVTDISAYRKMFRSNHVHLSTFFVEYDYEKNLTELNFLVLGHSHADFLPLLAALRMLQPTISITLSSQTEI